MSREVRSPVYQIDFTAVDAGKRIASSKRRIRWRFGFTNQDALAAGETGTACRGEEHDITLIWSITSGKRLVLADGQEVHYSNSRSQVFDFSWTMRGNHVLKVIAHVTTPMNAPHNFRQYDFFVDGMSFFSMPKVYRLGLTGADPIHEPGTLALAHSSRRNAYGNYSMGSGYGGASVPPSHRGPSSIVEIEAPHNAQEEEAYLREAIKASLSDVQQREQVMSSSVSYQQHQQHSKDDEQDDLLIDFMSEPGPAPAPTAPSAGAAAFAVVPAVASPAISAYTYGLSPPQMAVDPFAAPTVAPVVSSPVVDTSVGPSPGAAPVYNYSNFASAPAPLSSMPAVPAPMPPAAAPMPPAPMPATSPAVVPIPPAPAAAPMFSYASMGSYSTPSAPTPAPEVAPLKPPAATKGPGPDNAPLLSMQPESKGLGVDANAAYAKFANMDQFDLVKPKSTNRSNPFDDPIPAQTSNGGGGTLADMKAKNNSNGGEKKEIMKNSSMAVVQAPASNWNGYNNYGMGMQMGATLNGGGSTYGGPVPSQYGPAYGMTGAAPMNGMQPSFSQSNAAAYGQTYPQQQHQGYPPSTQPQFQQSQQGYGYGQTYPQQSF